MPAPKGKETKPAPSVIVEDAPKEKNNGGRPTAYDPSFCEKVIEWRRDGKSRTWMAAELGVHRQTLYEWMRVHPEFSDALTHAKQLEQKWWEDAGQQGMKQTGFNAKVWERNMLTRFRDDWQEPVRRIEHGQPGEFDLSEYSEDELRKAASVTRTGARGTSEKGTSASSSDRLH